MRSEGTHNNKAPQIVRGEGTHSNKPPRIVRGEGTYSMKNKREKNSKKPEQFIIFQAEARENYFSTSEDEVIHIEPEDKENSENSCIEEIFDNKSVEHTFNEQNSKINKKQQIKTRKNVKIIIIQNPKKTVHPQSLLHLTQNLSSKF